MAAVTINADRTIYDKQRVTYNVPLFVKQRVIKIWGHEMILFFLLMHEPFDLKVKSVKNIILQHQKGKVINTM